MATGSICTARGSSTVTRSGLSATFMEWRSTTRKFRTRDPLKQAPGLAAEPSRDFLGDDRGGEAVPMRIDRPEVERPAMLPIVPLEQRHDLDHLDSAAARKRAQLS